MTTRATRSSPARPTPSPAQAKELPFAAVVHYDEAGERYLSAVDRSEAAKHLGDQERHGRRVWFHLATAFVVAGVGFGHMLRFFQDQQAHHFAISVVLAVAATVWYFHVKKLQRTVPGAQRIETAPCPFLVPDRVLNNPPLAMDVIHQLQWADPAEGHLDMHYRQAQRILGLG